MELAELAHQVQQPFTLTYICIETIELYIENFLEYFSQFRSISQILESNIPGPFDYLPPQLGFNLCESVWYELQFDMEVDLQYWIYVYSLGLPFVEKIEYMSKKLENITSVGDIPRSSSGVLVTSFMMEEMIGSDTESTVLLFVQRGKRIRHIDIELTSVSFNFLHKYLSRLPKQSKFDTLTIRHCDNSDDLNYILRYGDFFERIYLEITGETLGKLLNCEISKNQPILSIKASQTHLKNLQINKINRHFPNLEHLEISTSNKNSQNKFLVKLNKADDQYEEKNLDFQDKLSNEFLTETVKEQSWFPCLQKLICKETHIGFLFSATYPALMSLNICDVDSNILLAIDKYCPSLQTFEISEAKLSSHCTLTSHVAWFAKLNTLIIHYSCEQSTNMPTQPLMHSVFKQPLPTIQNLTLDNSHSEEVANFLTFHEPKFVHKMLSLECLDLIGPFLWNHIELFSPNLIKLFWKCRQSLNVPDFTDKQKGKPFLKALILEICDYNIFKIVKPNVNQLTKLSITGIKKVLKANTDYELKVDISDVACSCPNLKYLKLKYCRVISNATVPKEKWFLNVHDLDLEIQPYLYANNAICQQPWPAVTALVIASFTEDGKNGIDWLVLEHTFPKLSNLDLQLSLHKRSNDFDRQVAARVIQKLKSFTTSELRWFQN